jgi:general L-amino acid transport system permease protein
MKRHRIILLGRYPQGEHWRAEIATFLLLGLVVASCSRWFWKPWLALLWLVVLSVFFTLMSGGILGLAKVTTDQWGGLPLTVMLTVISMTAAFPIAVAVALGRRSNMPAIRTLCVLYVELDPRRAADLGAVHGLLHVPAVAAYRQIARRAGARGGRHHAFCGAYMAEMVRGGLQSLPAPRPRRRPAWAWDGGKHSARSSCRKHSEPWCPAS